ncbi:MAG: Uma2 family endonuclease [Fimbriimonadaceae bacterium]|nr:Uma2 family endonuclease [Fimbriimonadaceae bacterium]
MSAARRHTTPAEYLAAERAAEAKSEYWDGQIVGMAGGSRWHSLIATATSAALQPQLRGGPCEVHGSDLRVHLPNGRAYFYPDVSVYCQGPQLTDEWQDTALNPVVVVEVLSPSTESVDRTLKWLRYQTIASLQHFVLIAQDFASIEVYTRQGEQWLYRAWTDLAAVAELPAIGCRLPLAQVYDRVEFAAPAEPEER